MRVPLSAPGHVQARDGDAGVVDGCRRSLVRMPPEWSPRRSARTAWRRRGLPQRAAGSRPACRTARPCRGAVAVVLLQGRHQLGGADGLGQGLHGVGLEDPAASTPASMLACTSSSGLSSGSSCRCASSLRRHRRASTGRCRRPAHPRRPGPRRRSTGRPRARSPPPRARGRFANLPSLLKRRPWLFTSSVP